MEYIKYLAYITKEVPKQLNPNIAPTSLDMIMAYGIAKGKANNPREIEPLQDFCPFKPGMQTKADSG